MRLLCLVGLLSLCGCYHAPQGTLRAPAPNPQQTHAAPAMDTVAHPVHTLPDVDPNGLYDAYYSQAQERALRDVAAVSKVPYVQKQIIVTVNGQQKAVAYTECVPHGQPHRWRGPSNEVIDGMKFACTPL